jgi:hypothetical protein
MIVVTYPAIIRNGKAEPLAPLDLPEGSAVYIVIQPKLDERTARKKATGWLVDHVGNLLMAADGVLVQQDERWIWRFNAYLTSLTHEPRGPIGQVEVDADTGHVLNAPTTIASMYERGQHFIHPAPAAN